MTPCSYAECGELTDRFCFLCRTYHHVDCKHSMLGFSTGDPVEMPLAWLHDPDVSDTNSKAAVTTPSVDISADSPEVVQEKRDYASGIFSFLALGAMVAYSTWKDRSSQGSPSSLLKVEYVEKLGQCLLPPTDGARTPVNIAWLASKEGFKAGFDWKPMPFPRELASVDSIRRTMHIGLFSLVAEKGDFEDCRKILNRASFKERIVGSAIDSAITTRNMMRNHGALGYGSGSMLYGYLSSFVVKGLGLNSAVLSLQMPWDAVMIVNQLSVNVGRNARVWQQMDSNSLLAIEEIIRSVNKPYLMRMQGMALGAGSLAFGLAVTGLFKSLSGEGPLFSSQKKLEG